MGTVRQGGTPVTDAWVTHTASGYTWTSGHDGFFSMLKVPAGTALTVTAAKAGVGTKSLQVPALAPGEVRRLDIHLGPDSYVSNTQNVRVAAGSGYQELFYNYSTGAVSISPYAATSDQIPFAFPKGQWIGVFHYDYEGGRFTQAIYSYGDVLY